MNDVTITFVCSHYPRKMLKILKAERNIDAEQTAKGIYKLKNDPISMQILLISKLPPEENLWLSSLTRNLPMNRNTELLLREYQKHKASSPRQSYGWFEKSKRGQDISWTDVSTLWFIAENNVKKKESNSCNTIWEMMPLHKTPFPNTFLYVI